MKIVEYHSKYAASIADMWNKSTSNWGNEDEIKTEQDVIDSEKSSGNIKTYLAVDKEQVIGYCSFSEYKYDEGASYLPLINVRPDYQGKKVGKALILKILDVAKQSRWPRFDLFTWSGNIKAMPLYKKCGFFWERNNNSVHLMNFIPYVYQSEALKPYINQLDLYNDNIREIHMDYDGEDKNGFEIYYYRFSNIHTHLTLGFEKTARGLVYVDNPDYEISVIMDKHKLVYPKKYIATLKVVNKGHKLMDVSISAQHNKNIQCDFHHQMKVKDQQEIDLPFFVDVFEKKQDLDKTHPSLVVNVHINHKKLVFKRGIHPKSPIELELHSTDWVYSKNKTYHAYLNIENNLDHRTCFNIQLPNTNIEFLNDINISLEKEEKRSVKVPFIIHSFGIYSEKAKIHYDDVVYNKEVKAMFKGVKESFVSNLDKKLMLVSGNYVLVFDKESQNIRYINSKSMDNDTSFMAPKIGFPYSLEFSIKKPEIDILSGNHISLLYKSEAFKDVYIQIDILNNQGILEITYSIQNKGDERELSMSIPIVKNVGQTYIPYQSKLLKTNAFDGYIGNINVDLIDENWMYNDKQKQGFAWPDDIKIKVSDWHMSFNVESLILKKNESYRSKPFMVSYVHASLKDFRHFVESRENKQRFGYTELKVSKNNPFIGNDSYVQYINHRKAQIKGKIEHNNHLYELNQTINVKEGLQTFNIELADRIINKKCYLFKPKGRVKTHVNNGIYTIDNGLLSFKADIKHSDSVFSLRFNDKEWLDSNYPRPKERAWWASFIGGITHRIHGIQDIVAIKEKRFIDCVEIRDNLNNLWIGLKIRTHYQSDPELKGTITDNYILTMPGIPLIHTFTNIYNQSGKLIYDRYMHRRYTINLDIYKEQVRFREKGTTFKVGEQAIDMEVDQCLSLESTREHRMVFYNHSVKHIFDSQKEYIMFFGEKKMTIPDRESKIFDGEFVFFTKDSVDKEDLRLLDNIRFEERKLKKDF